MKMNTQLMGAAIALALATSSVQANLITNPGFETGDLTGWTDTPAPSGSLFSVSASAAHTGDYALWFGAVSGYNDTVSQTVATTPGATYKIEFWLAGNYESYFQADWNGSPLLQYYSADNFEYTYFSFTALASGSSTTLAAFGGRNAPAWCQLDDVSVTQVVPESSTWLAGAGASLAMLGSFVRRNRK